MRSSRPTLEPLSVAARASTRQAERKSSSSFSMLSNRAMATTAATGRPCRDTTIERPSSASLTRPATPRTAILRDMQIRRQFVSSRLPTTALWPMSMKTTASTPQAKTSCLLRLMPFDRRRRAESCLWSGRLDRETSPVSIERYRRRRIARNVGAGAVSCWLSVSSSVCRGRPLYLACRAPFRIREPGLAETVAGSPEAESGIGDEVEGRAGGVEVGAGWGAAVHVEMGEFFGRGSPGEADAFHLIAGEASG